MVMSYIPRDEKVFNDFMMNARVLDLTYEPYGGTPMSHNASVLT